MVTSNASKIKKSVLPNITFILNVISENGTSFFGMVLFFIIKNNVNFTRTYLKQGFVCVCKYAKMYYVTSVCCMVK